MTQTIKTPMFTLKGRTYIAKCVKCYDADTVHVVLKENNVYNRFCCRLMGIDTAELKTKNVEENEHAKKARDYLTNLIMNNAVYVVCHDFDKYGRLLITLYQPQEDTTQMVEDDATSSNSLLQSDTASTLSWENSINNLLVKEKYAYQYDGGKKLPFNEWALSP